MKNDIWLDSLSCSIHYKNLLRKRNKIIENIDPIYFLKSIKNSTEIKNMKKSHIIDGVALTKFLFWLKRNFKRKEMQTEIQKQLRMMPGQEKMLQEYYQKNPSILANLRGQLYEEKIIKEIKQKAKSNLKEITKDQAEKLLKEENDRHMKEHHGHDHNNKHDNDHSSEKKSSSSKNVSSPTKTKTIATKTLTKLVNQPKLLPDHLFLFSSKSPLVLKKIGRASCRERV